MDLSVQDVSAILKLVREVTDRWDDPAAWRAHLLRGACDLLGGNVGFMTADLAGKDGAFGRPAMLCAVGVPDEKRPLIDQSISMLARRRFDDVSENVMPGISAMYATIVKQGWVTAARSDITDPATYHAAPMYVKYRRPMDCDDFVMSIRIVDVPRRPEGISVNRPHGASPFTRREVSLLKVLHDEIAPMIGIRLAVEGQISRQGLSKRLGQVLDLLLGGLSEKEVARTLGIGVRTAHEYVSALYRHFNVSSRAELMSYFIRREVRCRQPSITNRGVVA